MEAKDVGSGLDAQLGVEVGERLVHEEDGRLAHDGSPERDALALAAGELTRLPVEVAGQVEDGRGFLDAGLDLDLGDVAELEAERQVVPDGHVWVERIALEDHRDVAILRRDVVDDLLADSQRSVGDLFQAGDHAQAGGLAAAGRPDEDHELRVADVEVEVVHGDDVAVSLGDVLESDSCHAARLPWFGGPMSGDASSPVWRRHSSYGSFFAKRLGAVAAGRLGGLVGLSDAFRLNSDQTRTTPGRAEHDMTLNGAQR